jgi:hypothetical protein
MCCRRKSRHRYSRPVWTIVNAPSWTLRLRSKGERGLFFVVATGLPRVPAPIWKCDPMGEAKRRRAAIENGPCPCGSAKPGNMCCYNGQVRHKPPAVPGLRALPPKSAVAKCYMKGLGSCDGGISGEHPFSESIMLLLKGDGDFRYPASLGSRKVKRRRKGGWSSGKCRFTTPSVVSPDKPGSSADCHKQKTNTNAGWPAWSDRRISSGTRPRRTSSAERAGPSPPNRTFVPTRCRGHSSQEPAQARLLPRRRPPAQAETSGSQR